MTMKGFLAFLIGCVAFAAFAQVRVSNSTGSVETMNKVKPGMGVNSQDRRYFAEAKLMTVYCMRLSEIASRQSGGWVQEFGSAMLKDHVQNYGEIKVIGSKIGIKVDKQLPAAWQKPIDRLKATSGSNFEREFQRLYIGAKNLFAEQTEREIKLGNNSLVRNFAVTASPVTSLQIKMAKRKVSKI